MTWISGVTSRFYFSGGAIGAKIFWGRGLFHETINLYLCFISVLVQECDEGYDLPPLSDTDQRQRTNRGCGQKGHPNNTMCVYQPFFRFPS